MLAASATVSDDTGLHPLAGYAAKDVDYALLEVRQCVAEVAPCLEIQFGDFGRSIVLGAAV